MSTTLDSPHQKLFHHPTLPGVLLLVSAAVAILVANSPWAGAWDDFWHTKVALQWGGTAISNTLLHWVNDGLMALFFFVVGLELKREFLGGSLSRVKTAILPLGAAVGGMVFPALLYLAFNPSGPAHAGWGIPMATDIAFAVGILALMGSRVPRSLKVFVTALAIADDLGAVLVIAFFYTSQIDLGSLAAGLTFLAVLIGANFAGVRNPLFYGLVGIGGIWISFLASGIHASIAGVLIAFTIPARPRINEETFGTLLRRAVEEFLAISPNRVSLLEPTQVDALGRIQQITKAADTPLQRLEHSMAPLVGFVIMPIFALANAGIALGGPEGFSLGHPVTMGVASGLFVGKFVGIVGTTWLLTRLRWGELPPDLRPLHLIGAGLLCGIGFTMSLFIVALAFGEGTLAHQAKLGVVVASLVSGVLGVLVLRFQPRS